MAFLNKEDSDQPAHQCSLNRVFLFPHMPSMNPGESKIVTHEDSHLFTQADLGVSCKHIAS